MEAQSGERSPLVRASPAVRDIGEAEKDEPYRAFTTPRPVPEEPARKEAEIDHLPPLVWYASLAVKLLLLLSFVLVCSAAISMSSILMGKARSREHQYYTEECTVVRNAKVTFYTWIPPTTQRTMHGFYVPVSFSDHTGGVVNQSDWRTISPAASEDFIKDLYTPESEHTCFIAYPDASLPEDNLFWMPIMFALPQDYDITISVFFFTLLLVVSAVVGTLPIISMLLLDRYDSRVLSALLRFLEISDEGSRLRYANWYIAVTGLDLFLMLGMWPFIAAAILWNAGLFDCMVCLWPVIVLIIAYLCSYITVYWAVSGRDLFQSSVILSWNSQMSVVSIITLFYFGSRIAHNQELEWVYTTAMVLWVPYVLLKLAQFYFFVRGMYMQLFEDPAAYLNPKTPSIILRRGSALGFMGMAWIVSPYLVCVAAFVNTYILLHVDVSSFYIFSIWTIAGSFAPYLAFVGSVLSTPFGRKGTVILSTIVLLLLALEAFIGGCVFWYLNPEFYFRIPSATIILVVAEVVAAAVTYTFGMRADYIAASVFGERPTRKEGEAEPDEVVFDSGLT